MDDKEYELPKKLASINCNKFPLTI